MFDWGLLAISSFNTILPLWLGFTVLLNAERRSWGLWLAGGSLLAVGVFFLFHTALVEGSFYLLLPSISLGWYAGWIPVVALPFTWYLAMLWFTGYWETGSSTLRSFHRRVLVLVSLLLAGVLALVATADWSPRTSTGGFGITRSPSIDGLPFLIIVYSVYIFCCYLFSLHALRHIQPSGRVMGDLARMRAKPWLVATSWVQIAIAVLVTWAFIVVVTRAGGPVLSISQLFTLGWFDLCISLLIAACILLLGKAVVLYEIFTGKTLPRQGFRRHWRNAVILASGYSLLLGGIVVLDLPAIFTLLATSILIALFYALLNWRSYVGRDRYLEHLRPFLGSQQLYDQLLEGGDSPEEEQSTKAAFQALCSQVLGSRRASIIPLGPLAPLVGHPLSYPDNGIITRSLTDLSLIIDSPGRLCIPLEPADQDGMVWGVPLWSDRGLIGVLLLGEKIDGGLYTQEEIEIARASCERLLDTRAGAEMARRLMSLQRQRLAESQLLDNQTRRTLHDDILPRIHSTMLSLGGDQTAGAQEAIAQLTDLHRGISDLLHQMPMPAARAVERFGLTEALRRAVDGELRGAFDSVEWSIDPQAESAAGSLPSLKAEVLYYAAREAVRNAARYGRGEDQARTLCLKITVWLRDDLVIEIEDNGVGVERSVASDGGSGEGLRLHGTMMAVAGGSLGVDSLPGKFTRVTLALPVPSTEV